MITFDPSLSRDIDWIRAALGDTDPDTALLSDQQIEAVLISEQAQGGNRDTATFLLASQAVAAIVREPVRLSAAGEEHDYSQRLVVLQPLAEMWRMIQGRRTGTTHFDGRSTTSVTGVASW